MYLKVKKLEITQFIIFGPVLIVFLIPKFYLIFILIKK